MPRPSRRRLQQIAGVNNICRDAAELQGATVIDPEAGTTCQDISDMMDAATGSSLGDPTVCDQLKTITRYDGGEIGEYHRWLQYYGTTCCGSWQSTRCLDEDPIAATVAAGTGDIPSCHELGYYCGDGGCDCDHCCGTPWKPVCVTCHARTHVRAHTYTKSFLSPDGACQARAAT